MREPSPIRIEGDLAFIGLTKGLEAIVDVADVPLVSGKRWRASIDRKGHAYAIAGSTANKDSYVILHRLLMNPPPRFYVDHIDGDGLNNRRNNLRLANGAQNNANSYVTRRNRIGLKGVRQIKERYQAIIYHQEKRIVLGRFDSAEEASAAYYGAARILWGDFARK